MKNLIVSKLQLPVIWLVIVLIFGFSGFESFAQSSKTIKQARELIANEQLSIYHGWLKYLIFDVEVVAKRPGITKENTIEKQKRLETWVQNIKNNPNVIQTLRGVQEWAYESAVDGSGQPFMINIPINYDNNNYFPVTLYMHGYSGNHSEHFSGTPELKGMFELSVLGRSRGGGYIGLSEADVLNVIEYVTSNWRIDANRIHILGGSMGGNGTFRMGSRYPHLFASARPTCGFASDKPVGNLITLPIYATHSNDDFVVPIILSRGPIERIQELGGQAIIDVTNGLGHASWNYKEGNERGNIWFRQQVRKPSQDIKYLNYTALDGQAMKAWWAAIEEWGNEPKPATFILSANENNTLYAKLLNINELKINIKESPFNKNKPLLVSVNGEPVLELKNPVPDEVYIKHSDKSWQVSGSSISPTFRKHTPGGPNLLYNGEPLLIVYGTKGSKDDIKAMYTAAQVASQSSNAYWQKPSGDKAADNIDHNINLYGNLLIKADVDVTKQDIEQSHLVLIGTEKQNSVVASISNNLPVSIKENKIIFNDGENYTSENMALGLVYYNPASPNKLIFWVASDDNRAYCADSPIPAQMTFPLPSFYIPAPGFDCLISRADKPIFVAARNFDSNWNLVPRDLEKKIISPTIKTNKDFFDALSNSIKQEASADFGYVEIATKLNADFQPEKGKENQPFESGVRLSDLVNRFFYEPIGIVELSADELLQVQSKLKAKGQSIFPEPTKENVISGKKYKLALNQLSIWSFITISNFSPSKYRFTDLQVSGAIERYFPVD